MLSLNPAWRTEPYRIGIANDVFDRDTYAQLVESFPKCLQQFVDFTGGNVKKSLSQVNNPDLYYAFLKLSKPWQAFYEYVKTLLIADVRRIVELPDAAYTSRFEFSALPANGGCLRPHTDIPSKVVTLIIPMLRPGDWEPQWGGGTDVLSPRPGNDPPEDYKADLSAFNRVATYDYAPNQALVFIKSANSWHSVGPIQGPAGKWRRTVTVNVERK